MYRISGSDSGWPDIRRVPTGQGKLEKVREFAWSGKVRENLTI